MEKEQRSPWRVPINLERYKDGYIEITSLQNQLLNAKLKQADVIHWKNHVRSLLVPLTKKTNSYYSHCNVYAHCNGFMILFPVKNSTDN